MLSIASTAVSATAHSHAPALRDARETERVIPYLQHTWQRRGYAWYVATSELRSRQMNTVLGNLWHLLNPALQIGVYYLVFGVVLDVSRGVDNFIAFLTVGVFVYGFTQRSVMLGAKSIYKNRGLIRIVSFPRVLLPVTSTLTEALAAVPSYALIVAVPLITGEPLRWTMLLVVPLFVVQTCFNSGVACIAARATNHVADVQQVLPFIFRLGFYASGVLFNVEAYVETHRWMFDLNPMYCFITLYRWAVFGGDLDSWILVSTPLWTVGIVLVGFLWFRRGEDQYGRD